MKTRPRGGTELHPFFTQEPLREFHAKHGIRTEAWSPLGGIHRYRPADPDAVLNALEDPTVTSIADKHGKTPAQVAVPCGPVRTRISSDLTTTTVRNDA